MDEKALIFLAEVRDRAKDPEMMLKILQHAVAGVQKYAAEARSHGVDMEIVANMAMNTRLFKGNEKFLADKLEKWSHMSALRWDDQIAKLKEKNNG